MLKLALVIIAFAVAQASEAAASPPSQVPESVDPNEFVPGKVWPQPKPPYTFLQCDVSTSMEMRGFVPFRQTVYLKISMSPSFIRYKDESVSDWETFCGDEVKCEFSSDFMAFTFDAHHGFSHTLTLNRRTGYYTEFEMTAGKMRDTMGRCRPVTDPANAPRIF